MRHVSRRSKKGTEIRTNVLLAILVIVRRARSPHCPFNSLLDICIVLIASTAFNFDRGNVRVWAEHWFEQFDDIIHLPHKSAVNKRWSNQN